MHWWSWLRREWHADHGWLRIVTVIGGCLLMAVWLGGR